MKTPLHAFCVLLVLLSPSPSRADDGLRAEIEKVIDAPRYQQASWGLLIVELDSAKTLYERNADRLFAPASVTKLYSVATALDAFGKDYRFETPVYRRGRLDEQGRLDGDLILVASGDPTLGSRTLPDGSIAYTDGDHTYANGNETAKLTEPDPLAGLNALARQVAESGIKRVRGDVLIDDRLFDKAEGTGSGPSRLTPIVVNDNLIDVLVTPGKAGELATVKTRPETAAWQIDARVETVPTSRRTTLRITAPAPGKLVVRGQIPEGHKPLVKVYEVEDAASFARSLFIEALGRAGVVVEASPLGSNKEAELPRRGSYEKLTRAALFTSPPFSEEAKLILKVSHNLHASLLPLLVAVKHNKRTLDAGLRLQHDFLAKAGLKVDTISFGSGAGGSRGDCTTPRATVELLRYMTTRPDFAAYDSGLPVLGENGTLADAVKRNSPARGKVRAKTGTYFWQNTMNRGFLLTSKALAGYMTTADGRKLAFAVFLNNLPIAAASDTTREGRTLGHLCEVVYGKEEEK